MHFVDATLKKKKYNIVYYVLPVLWRWRAYNLNNSQKYNKFLGVLNTFFNIYYILYNN